MKQFIKRMLVLDSAWMKYIIKFINRFPFLNHIQMNRSNQFSDVGILFQSNVVIRGSNNKIIIERGAKLRKCKILVFGDNNTVHIGSRCSFHEAELHIEDCSGAITIGEGTAICGKTHLACIEGRTISIGKDCLFSSDVTVRTGDSHSILDMRGNRINPSKDVVLGNHVWIGNRTIVLKGAVIPDNSIIATGAVVTKSFDKESIIIGGNPAKILKEEINWCGKRI